MIRMQRFFFHVQDGSETLDDVGTELPGLAEARAEAVRTSGEMLRDLGEQFWNSAEWRMWVTDETGRSVCALRFSAEHDRAP
jgi:hypothetical protein